MIDIEQFDDMDELPSRVQIKKPVDLRRHNTKAQPTVDNQLQDNIVSVDDFPFSYTPSKFEGKWLTASIGGFYEEHWFDDVLRMIKGGKEASVYLCRGNETTRRDLLAAKVYRPRMYRNLKDDFVYREGRSHLDESGLELRDDRAERALAKRTNYGLSLLHTDWIQHEFNTMKTLFEAGGALPKPFVCANNAILMEYIGDEDTPAPTLNTVNLNRRSAARLFGRVVENIRLMLNHDLVHGDFSAYNLLYWEDDIWMIDFPQAFPCHRNRSAWPIFMRDVKRVSQYFMRQGVNVDPNELAVSLWKEKGLPVVSESGQMEFEI
jgi:RIO kinase 1